MLVHRTDNSAEFTYTGDHGKLIVKVDYNGVLLEFLGAKEYRRFSTDVWSLRELAVQLFESGGDGSIGPISFRYLPKLEKMWVSLTGFDAFTMDEPSTVGFHHAMEVEKYLHASNL